MNRMPAVALKSFVVLLALSLAGCVTYYQPRYSDDGIYYGDGYYASYSHSYVVDPVYYPYWSLDYFYFSYYRQPYSVVYYHDPFFRPYPGWYYGYRPGPRFRFAASYGHWYPWYGAGFHYHYYRPWYRHHHYHHHYHHHAKPAIERRQRAVLGAHGDRGRSLYQTQRRDASESFTLDGDRRAMRAAGVPKPGDRTTVTSLAPQRGPAERRAAIQDRTTIPRDVAEPTADRRARPRAHAPEGRTNTRSQAPRSRTPTPGTQPQTRPETTRAPPRRSAPPPVERPRSEPASPPPAPPPRSAPPRESSSPPARSRSESGGDRRRPR